MYDVTYLKEAIDGAVVFPVRVERHLRQPHVFHNPRIISRREHPGGVFRNFITCKYIICVFF